MAQAFSLPSIVPRLLTQDLVLRPIETKDAPSYFELCSNSQVMKGWGTSAHKTIEETKALILYLQEQLKLGQMIRWGITLKEENSKIIGDVGFWRFVPMRFRGEVGAKLHPSHWKKSYMTQALARVIRAGFEDLGLNSVEGNVEVDNLASLRLVEKLGFIKEGLIHQHTFSDEKNKFVDTYLYSVLKDQWHPLA